MDWWLVHCQVIFSSEQDYKGKICFQIDKVPCWYFKINVHITSISLMSGLVASLRMYVG